MRDSKGRFDHRPRPEMRGEKHHLWAGDDVKYEGVHWWVKTHLPKPEFCEICNKAPPFDLANTTGIYNRDLKNWHYLCRRCHMKSDGRMKNLVGNSDKALKGWKTKYEKYNFELKRKRTDPFNEIQYSIEGKH